MKPITPKENEPRTEYLVRVAIAMLEDNGWGMKSICYDEAECDALCLAEDLRIEFNIKTV